MVKSMTAYGRASGSFGGKEIVIELKSVNNRYLDCNIKVPRAYGYLEEKIKKYLADGKISRGKVDVYVSIDVAESQGLTVQLDEAYAEGYLKALYALRDRFGLADDITTMRVAANREMFLSKQPTEDAEAVWQEVQPILAEAVDAFLAMRESEGARLRTDLLQKKAHLVELVEQVKAASAGETDRYRDRLEEKLRQTLEKFEYPLDAARILTECAVFADRVAIDEELVRLASHFSAFDEMLDASEPIGRKLDFLLQEMNRETNTMGSKTSELAVTKIVIEMKNELEKIREQIQNLE